MNKIGMIEGKDIRSSVVGNSSHIFFIAPLTAKEKEDLGLSTSPPPPPENGQDLDNVSSDEDSLDSFGEGDKENLSFLLKMYDRHSMTLIDTFGKFTLGVYTRVQIYKNTLMAVDRSTPGVNKVKKSFTKIFQKELSSGKNVKIIINNNNNKVKITNYILRN